MGHSALDARRHLPISWLLPELLLLGYGAERKLIVYGGTLLANERSQAFSHRGKSISMAIKQSTKDKIEGKLHEVKGALTGNKTEEFLGKAQGAKGAIVAKVTPEKKPAKNTAGEKPTTVR